MDIAVALIQFVVHHRTQQVGFAEEFLHLEVALLVQLVGCYPHVSHPLVGTVTTRLQLLRQFVQHLRSHHRLARPRGSLEDKLLPVSRQAEQLYRLLY